MPRCRSLALFACVVALAGCAPNKEEVEQLVRDDMKSKMNVEITAITLEKQSDGTYAGTATAANGDTYEVITEKPKRGHPPGWKALPGQGATERLLRELIESKWKQKVVAFDLTREAPGAYRGTVTLESGRKLKVTPVGERHDVSEE